MKFSNSRIWTKGKMENLRQDIFLSSSFVIATVLLLS